MAGYKIETHLHTPIISPCGRLTPEQLVEGYLQAGFSAITVTDHYHSDAFHHAGIDPEGKDTFHAFLEGYRAVCRAAEGTPLRVYYGAELRFRGCGNDYLLFGFPEELLQNPQEVWAMGIVRFSELARSAGALLIQAHPYRTGCRIADHRFLDGVEVLNMNPDHLHHNDNHKTLAYAQRWPELIRTSGSDCHQTHHLGRGGIIADWLPKDDHEFAQLLRSKNCELIGSFDSK